MDGDVVVRTVARPIQGKLVKGLGIGGRYVSHPYYTDWFKRLLGCTPYPGTLNVWTDTDWRELASQCRPIVIPEAKWNGVVLGSVYVWRARLEELAELVALIRPLKSRHEPEVLEIVACKKLRPHLKTENIVIIVECYYEPPFTNPPRLVRTNIE